MVIRFLHGLLPTLQDFGLGPGGLHSTPQKVLRGYDSTTFTSFQMRSQFACDHFRHLKTFSDGARGARAARGDKAILPASCLRMPVRTWPLATAVRGFLVILREVTGKKA